MGVAFSRQEGAYRFVAIFNWTYQEDEIALKRFQPYFSHSFEGTGIDAATAVCLYLTGARTVIFSGFTTSAQGLQRFCSSIVFGTAIEVSFYHAVDANEISQVLPL
ncbi:MAG: hypothetical protein HY913_11140 [Desulfomonile tiedjei]|nr:hypothetical protein [Desulfomonile tiedjei]